MAVQSVFFNGFVPGVGFRVAWTCLVDRKIDSIVVMFDYGPRVGDLGAWRTRNTYSTDNTRGHDHLAYFLTLRCGRCPRGGADKGPNVLYRVLRSTGMTFH